ncbi:MAG: Allantoicase [Chrysothrix sp. TS-e1954]|nr:MAG: Allantoicase [Chrysothrix sp. TS-e1954]
MEFAALSPEIIQDTISPSSANDSIQVIPVPTSEIDSTFSSTTINLLHPSLPSTRVLSFSDEFFAPASSLLHPHPPIHKPNTYTPAGAWYDGWETRRHNPSPPDYVIFRIGVPAGVVKGVEIDTGFFSGNHAEHVSVTGLFLDSGHETFDDAAVAKNSQTWETILPPQKCNGSTRHAWLLPSLPGQKRRIYTHIRLHMHPDGGIARFRLHGSCLPIFPPATTTHSEPIDLAALTSGALAIACSDEHFGRKANLLLPGRGVDMGDGWETGRSRGRRAGDGDWVILRLGAGCLGQELERAVVDTAFFRGNYPQSVALSVAFESLDDDAKRRVGKGDEDEGGEEVVAECPAHAEFLRVLEPTPLGPDREHVFTAGGELRTDALQGKVVRWVKMEIFPDGGVKRLRVFGRRYESSTSGGT